MGSNAARDSIIKAIMTGAGFSGFVDIVLFITKLLGVIAAITTIALLAVNIAKWAKAGDNPGKRQEAQGHILTCCICLAILGGFGTVYAILLAFVF